ncbi:phosphate ABC transporter substrate-binding protein PstS [Bradyrhizobium yuanmingense]|uniref:phosphate ABC transporter substrate-binding protein PstS n=1 Tax=Bradyrhizobium yuanmingense TaxID=108015 RepID=UPI0023B8E341|nr:phosphate ABC transporter substrate-binding protein PstS [Bradyrhizobium yuanmingense]MDF0522840.1 phosphate ABC transporter substrate-binding protein PstS [Bradyrhizobium yuanmingense]
MAVAALSAHGQSRSKAPGQIESITGTGSTTAFPAMVKWIDSYRKVSGVTVDYQSLGSGAGINQIQAKTVDFGLGAALDFDSLRRLELVQWPIAVSGIEPVINLPGITREALKLDGQVLADIYLGKIKKWNDRAVRALNPELTLPNLDVHPVHWSNGSSTTSAFTAYLSAASTEWRVRAGTNSSIQWPASTGAKSNEGVTAAVIQKPGAIGYVDHRFANDNRLTTALIANQNGKFIKPDKDTLAKCVLMFGVDKGPPPPQLSLGRGDAAAICDVQFVFIHEVSRDPRRTAAVLAFFDWVLTHGAEAASQAHLGAVPAEVAVRIRGLWSRQLRGENGQQVYP